MSNAVLDGYEGGLADRFMWVHPNGPVTVERKAGAVLVPPFNTHGLSVAHPDRAEAVYIRVNATDAQLDEIEGKVRNTWDRHAATEEDDPYLGVAILNDAGRMTAAQLARSPEARTLCERIVRRDLFGLIVEHFRPSADGESLLGALDLWLLANGHWKPDGRRPYTEETLAEFRTAKDGPTISVMDFDPANPFA